MHCLLLKMFSLLFLSRGHYVHKNIFWLSWPHFDYFSMVQVLLGRKFNIQEIGVLLCPS